MLKDIKSKIDLAISKWVSSEGDSFEYLLAKKLFFISLLSNAILLALFLPIFKYLNLEAWFYLGIFYCLFFLSVALLFLRIRRYLDDFVLAVQLFFLIFSFFMVVAAGGILQSGGTIFIGLGAVSFMVGRERVKRSQLMLFLYLGTIALELVLQPWIPAFVILPDQINLAFFVIHLSIVISVMLTFVKKNSQMENQLQEIEKEKFRDLDNAKNKFFTNISHEFRTPLAVISGMVDQIRTDPKRWYSEGLQMIKRNGDDLLDLVNQILDLSRLDASMLPIHYTSGDILPFIRYVVESISSLADIHHARLEINTDLQSVFMDYDSEKLQRVLTNLISNAIKFNIPGGSVTILIEQRLAQELQFESDPKSEVRSFLAISVIDTGIGIAVENLPHIFDRYYKIEDTNLMPSTTGISRKGSGLGLALVKNLLQLMHGYIEVESEKGQGTRFTFYLPVLESRDLPVKPHVIPGSIGVDDLNLITAKAKPGRSHILIVEDNQDVMIYIRSLLEAFYSVQTAKDGQQGIENAINQIPDLIVSDIMMPVKDGLELCKTLKNDIRTCHIPIILLTAKADVQSRIEGIEKGADAYISKPFIRQELLTQIQQLISLRGVLRKKYASEVFTLTPSEVSPDLDEVFLHRVISLVQNHYQNPDFDLTFICRDLGMSRSQLHKKLKALTGKSITHFLRSYRLSKAKEQILNSNLTITEIAYATGFSDPAYFSRTFVKEFGCSPSKLKV